MIVPYRMYSKQREQSDMEELEILGSITFDLQINKEECVKKAFQSLVQKLGTKEFTYEYSVLYMLIVRVAEHKRKNDVIDMSDIDISTLPYRNEMDVYSEMYKYNSVYSKEIEENESTSMRQEGMMQEIDISECVHNKK